jgi:hypothetical protein
LRRVARHGAVRGFAQASTQSVAGQCDNTCFGGIGQCNVGHGFNLGLESSPFVPPVIQATFDNEYVETVLLMWYLDATNHFQFAYSSADHGTIPVYGPVNAGTAIFVPPNPSHDYLGNQIFGYVGYMYFAVSNGGPFGDWRWSQSGWISYRDALNQYLSYNCVQDG